MCLLFVFPFSLSLSSSLFPLPPLSIVERLSRNVVHALYRRFVVNVARLSARCSSRASLVDLLDLRIPNPSRSFRSSRSNRESVSWFRSITRAQTGQLFVIVYQPFRLLSPSPRLPLDSFHRNRFRYPILHPSFPSLLYRFILTPSSLYFLHLPQIRSLSSPRLLVTFRSCAGKENEYFMETDRYWGVHYRYCPALRIDLKEGRRVPFQGTRSYRGSCDWRTKLDLLHEPTTGFSHFSDRIRNFARIEQFSFVYLLKMIVNLIFLLQRRHGRAALLPALE